MRSASARPALARVAAAYRDSLAANYFSASEAMAALNVDARMLDDMRDQRRLLGVWHRPSANWLYPDFQFDSDGLVHEVPLLLSLFLRHRPHVWEDTWLIVAWFMTPHLLLDGVRPAELLKSDADRVLKVGLIDLSEDLAAL